MLSCEIGQYYVANCFTKKRERNLTHPILASWMAQQVKNPPAMHETQETQVWYLGQEDPLEKEMSNYSSILTWKIPEEPGGLQSMGLQRVENDWASKHSTALHPILYWIFLLINYFPDNIAQGIKIQSCIMKRF